MKKISRRSFLAAAGVSAAALALTACGGSSNSTAASTATSAAASTAPAGDAAAAASDPKVTLVYAEVNPLDTIVGQTGSHFKEKVEELTGGSVVVDVQASGVLGSENDVLDAILGGSTSIENEEEEKIQEKGGVSALDSTLFAILKDLRKKIAKTNNLPPYVIFQDPSLEDMCTNYPITLEELANIQGVGAGKAQKYGKEFVEVIKQYVEDNEIERAQDMVVKTVANKSKFKVYIIQNIDRQIDLEDIASALGLNFDELIKEMEAIVFSGTKLNIDYYINKILDEEQQQEIMDYFMEASSDNISEAFDEFEGDYAEEDLRLMRLKLHSKHGN